MKLVPSFVAALLLLAVAPLAGAADRTAAELQPPTQAIELDDLFASEECASAEQASAQDSAQAAAQAALDGQEPLPLAFQTCGACSESGCRGARRGQFCGFNKHCNIFSGGFMCPTGGWECQCRAGDLP